MRQLKNQMNVTNMSPREVNKWLIFYKRQGGRHLKSKKGKTYILFGGQDIVR